jgi:hypothetical protein
MITNQNIYNRKVTKIKARNLMKDTINFLRIQIILAIIISINMKNNKICIIKFHFSILKIKNSRKRKMMELKHK